ncbi:MAG: HAMP domain-containing sensor histidine kinase [Longimicrobiales bacterium]
MTESTELKEAQAGNQEIELVRESKVRLVRAFSHDIKNPLGAADGFAQLMLDGLMGDLSDKQQDAVTRIRASIATALSIINNVVEFARAEAGQIEIRPSPFATDSLVREVVAEHGAAAEAAGVTLATGPLDGGRITSDAVRIHQILGHLVSNAIRYGGAGGEGVAPGAGGTVTVSATLETGDLSRVLFTVTDEGQGIPEDEQHLLFQEFQRLQGGRKEGTGLGLAISRHIARALSGDVIVDSATGRGSTFTLRIPAVPAA